MAELVKLKMINGERYHCHKVKDDVIVKGEIVEVEQEVADILLDDIYVDGLGNEHHYFEETSDEEESAKARRASRRSGKATAPAEQDADASGSGDNS